MIKISVIIPIYNMEKYLEECLDSIVGQTLQDIEIICVNDGSTDETQNILDTYAQKDTRIVLRNQENQGVARARNNGINIAKGRYIAFMDPDDYYPSNDVLETLYSAAIIKQVMVCGGSMCFFDVQGEKVPVYGEMKACIFDKNKVLQYRQYQYMYGFTRFIYDTEMLKKNHICFPEYSRFQDPPFMVQAFVCAGKFFAMTKDVYCYRRNHKRLKYTAKVVQEQLKGIRDIMIYAIQEELPRLFERAIQCISDTLRVNIFLYYMKQDTTVCTMINEINQLSQNFVEKHYDDIAKDLFDLKTLEDKYNRSASYFQVFSTKMQQADNIYIYGAGDIGKLVVDFMEQMQVSKELIYVVTGERREKTVNGHLLKSIYDSTLVKNGLVIIAAGEKIQGEMSRILDELHFENYIIVDYISLILYQNASEHTRFYSAERI